MSQEKGALKQAQSDADFVYLWRFDRKSFGSYTFRKADYSVWRIFGAAYFVCVEWLVDFRIVDRFFVVLHVFVLLVIIDYKFKIFLLFLTSLYELAGWGRCCQIF